MRHALCTIAAALACAVALAAPAAAMPPMDGAGPSVYVGYDAYAPPLTFALVGQTVTWTNESVRMHTVTDIGDAWSSPRLVNGEMFTHVFDAPGTFQYYCQVHPYMRGEVDVYPALLDPQPLAAAPGKPFPLTGRAEPGAQSVAIEADTGAGFQPLTTATVGPDGRFAANVVPSTTTIYRVLVNGAASPPVTLLALDRKLTVRRTRGRGGRSVIGVHATPAAPGATVVLQLRLRDRFGWWPLLQARLDKASNASFVLRWRQRVPARVLLTLPDGATALATSRTLHIGGR